MNECAHVWRGHVIHIIYYMKENTVNGEMHCGPAADSAEAGQVSCRGRAVLASWNWLKLVKGCQSQWT